MEQSSKKLDISVPISHFDFVGGSCADHMTVQDKNKNGSTDRSELARADFAEHCAAINGDPAADQGRR